MPDTKVEPKVGEVRFHSSRDEMYGNVYLIAEVFVVKSIHKRDVQIERLFSYEKYPGNYEATNSVHLESAHIQESESAIDKKRDIFGLIFKEKL